MKMRIATICKKMTNFCFFASLSIRSRSISCSDRSVAAKKLFEPVVLIRRIHWLVTNRSVRVLDTQDWKHITLLIIDSSLFLPFFCTIAMNLWHLAFVANLYELECKMYEESFRNWFIDREYMKCSNLRSRRYWTYKWIGMLWYIVSNRKTNLLSKYIDSNWTLVIKCVMFSISEKIFFW